MTFAEIFNSTITLWPNPLDFADGIIIEAKQQTKKKMLAPPPKDTFYSPGLSAIFQRIKEQVNQEDNFRTVMVWTQFQYLSKRAQQEFTLGNTSLYTQDLEKHIIEESYFADLIDGMYEKELREYERVI